MYSDSLRRSFKNFEFSQISAKSKPFSRRLPADMSRNPQVWTSPPALIKANSVAARQPFTLSAPSIFFWRQIRANCGPQVTRSSTALFCFKSAKSFRSFSYSVGESMRSLIPSALPTGTSMNGLKQYAPSFSASSAMAGTSAMLCFVIVVFI